MSNSSENLGTTGSEPPVLPVANLPRILYEWSALVPLVIYLASYGISHKLVGKTALGEFIGVGLFPKIGVIGSIVDLLKGGADYIDRACSVSEFRREVSDVNWGSVFPCANGAASDIITAYALRGAGKVIETAVHPPPPPANATTINKTDATAVSSEVRQFRRPQTLHVLRCTRKSENSISTRSNSKAVRVVLHIGLIAVLLGGAATSYLFGLYGTSAALLISVLFQASRQCIKVHVPSEYLGDNEKGRVPGCMLVAIHQNASTWYLYIGERGIIDGILNKSIIYCVAGRGGKWGTFCLTCFLRLLALLQLLDMTFVASQKGWDGVGLLVFICVAWLTEDLVYGERQMAKRWLNRYGITITLKPFEFTGRTPMLGAIQVFKDNPVHQWMDNILVPSDRRQKWLMRLIDGANEKAMRKLAETLDPADNNPADKKWVDDNLAWSTEAADIMKKLYTTA